MAPQKKRQNRRKAAEQPLKRLPEYLVEVLPGLKNLAALEIAELGASKVHFSANSREDEIIFRTSLPRNKLLSLRLAGTLNSRLYFGIPRPRSLLGDVHIKRLIDQIALIRKESADLFSSFRIEAAGSDSNIMQSLRKQISRTSGLLDDPESGELVIRLRPASLERNGWEADLRLTPLPLSARDWRRSNMRGALNANIAAAMLRMTRPHPSDHFLNLMCGSGTLLIERAFIGKCKSLHGIDIDPEALQCAEDNIEAAGMKSMITVETGDACQTSISPGSFDVIVSDLPWGEAKGSHSGNPALYESFMKEVNRISTRGCRLALLSQENALMNKLLTAEKSRWKCHEKIKVLQGGFHPGIYLLEKL